MFLLRNLLMKIVFFNNFLNELNQIWKLQKCKRLTEKFNLIVYLLIFLHNFFRQVLFTATLFFHLLWLNYS